MVFSEISVSVNVDLAKYTPIFRKSVNGYSHLSFLPEKTITILFDFVSKALES